MPRVHNTHYHDLLLGERAREARAHTGDRVRETGAHSLTAITDQRVSIKNDGGDGAHTRQRHSAGRAACSTPLPTADCVYVFGFLFSRAS